MKFKPSFSLSSVGSGLEQLKKMADALTVGDAYVVAGVTGKKAEEKSEGKPSSAELAVIHEFGAPEINVPARPFILATFDKHRQEYRRMLTVAVQKGVAAGVASGLAGAQEYLRLLNLIGMKMASDIKAYVTQGAGVPPPNSPATLARKLRKGAWKRKPMPALDEFGRLQDPGAAGTPRPLVDTGRMVGAITWLVRRGGDGK